MAQGSGSAANRLDDNPKVLEAKIPVTPLGVVMANSSHVVCAALDGFVSLGTVEYWSHRTRLSAGRKIRTHVTDIYEIRLSSIATTDDEQGLRALVQQFGRTSAGHEVEIRIAGPNGRTP